MSPLTNRGPATLGVAAYEVAIERVVEAASPRHTI
jgi:hypothetical protein